MKRTMVSFVVGVAMAFAVSCGGPEQVPRDYTSEPGPAKVTLTFSSTGCAYEGPVRTASGQVEIELVNEVDQEAHVDLLSIGDGGTFADLSAHVDEERARIESGSLPIGAPGFVTLLTTVEAAEGSTTSEEVAVSDGTIGFACIAFDGEQGTMYAAGPLEVTS